MALRGATGPTGPPGATGATGSGTATTTVEQIQDVVAAMLVGAGPVTLTYDDVVGTITINTATGQLAEGPGVSLNYNDTTHTMSVGTISKLNAQVGTGYQLAPADAGKLITLTNLSAIRLVVPPDATVPFVIGTRVDLAQTGLGQVTVAGATGVTVNGTPGLRLRAQFSGATLVKVAANSWLLFGDLI